MPICFFKFHHCGNDFVIIDDLGRGEQKGKMKEISKQVTRRPFGVGANNVLYLHNSDKADAFMRIYNETDIEGSNCGNGSLCVGKYLSEKLGKGRITIETISGVVSVEKLGENEFKARIGKVRVGKEVDISSGESRIHGTIVSVGEPHLVVAGKDISSADLVSIGEQVNSSGLFPERINVDLVEEVGPGAVKARFYERGCLEETYSCGTGSCCVAYFFTRGKMKTNIIMNGGTIQVQFRQNTAYIIGKPVKVYSGVLNG